jgi:ankyrin repeat protein
MIYLNYIFKITVVVFIFAITVSTSLFGEDLIFNGVRYSESEANEMMRKAFQRNADEQYNKDYPIFNLIKSGKLAEIKELAEANPSIVSNGDRYGNYPITEAVRSKNPLIVKYLISKGANVDQTGSTFTPLMSACMYADSAMVDLLLKNGANPNLKTGSVPPLLSASIVGKEKIALLIKFKASVNESDGDGKTALHTAASYNNVEGVKFLLAHGANPKLMSRRDGNRKPSEEFGASDEVRSILRQAENAYLGSGEHLALHSPSHQNTIENTDSSGHAEFVYKRGVDWLAIIFTCVVALGCLSREKFLKCRKPSISSSKLKLFNVAFWPEKFDPLIITLSCATCYAILWYLPYAGQNPLLLFLGFVVPFCTFLTTWKLLQWLTYEQEFSSNSYKHLAAALTTSLLSLQFGFEPWRAVTVKTFISLPLIFLFLKSSSVFAYRVFLIPAVFSLIFSVTRILSGDSFNYLAFRFLFNCSIIYSVLAAFLKTTTPTSQTILDWRGCLQAGRTIVPSGLNRNLFNRLKLTGKAVYAATHRYIAKVGVFKPSGGPIKPPPRPPERWFLYLNGQVTGPVLEHHLKVGAESGAWPPETPVCKEGSEEWLRLDTITSTPR